MSSFAVALQLEITVDKPRGLELTRDLLDQVVRRWSIDGAEPRGMRIRIIDWKHPGKGTRKAYAADQEDARLRFRGLLQEGRFTVNLRGN